MPSEDDELGLRETEPAPPPPAEEKPKVTKAPDQPKKWIPRVVLGVGVGAIVCVTALGIGKLLKTNTDVSPDTGSALSNGGVTDKPNPTSNDVGRKNNPKEKTLQEILEARVQGNPIDANSPLLQPDPKKPYTRPRAELKNGKWMSVSTNEPYPVYTLSENSEPLVLAARHYNEKDKAQGSHFTFGENGREVPDFSFQFTDHMDHSSDPKIDYLIIKPACASDPKFSGVQGLHKTITIQFTPCTKDQKGTSIDVSTALSK